MRNRTLKAYGGSLDGRIRVVVIAPSMAGVKRLLDAAGGTVSLHRLREYWSQSWNDYELSLIPQGEGIWVYAYSRSHWGTKAHRFTPSPAVSSIWGEIRRVMDAFEKAEAKGNR